MNKRKVKSHDREHVAEAFKLMAVSPDYSPNRAQRRALDRHRRKLGIKKFL